MSSFLDITSTSDIFHLPGGREMVNEIRIVELLSLAPQLTSPRALSLSNKSFSYSAAEILAIHIKQFSNIKSIDLSDIIAGRHEDEALKVLEILCNSLAGHDLLEVNVSDNALGKKGVIACQSILQGKSLQKLYFCNNGLSAEASELVTEILLAGGCPPLEVLHFYNNMSGAVGAQSSSQLVCAARDTLRDFRYSATRSGVEGCLPIAEALGQTSNLTHLDISDNSFGEEVIETLASAISQQNKLVYLNVRDSGLGEDGTREIFKALEAAQCSLQQLDLSGNDFTDDIVPDLITFLEKMPSLQSLSLDDSELSIDSCKQLSRALKSLTNLQTLSICHSQLTAGSVLYLARAVSQIPSFKLLSVDGNEICSEGVDVIRNVLTLKAKNLGCLDENDEDGEDDLEEVENEDIPSTETNEETGLEEIISQLHVS